MTWIPEVPGELPTLGPAVVDWMESNLASPSADAGLLTLTREQIDFALKFYEVDPRTGRRRFRRGVLSRSKGWGRSPFLGALAIAEAFADVVPDGWDAAGRPVGKPWSKARTPWVQLLAVSASQTRNSWTPVLEMVREGPLVNLRGVEALETFIVLPDRGRIEYVSASAVSREGNRPVFACLDQTESWTPQNGGTRLAAAVRRNLGKVGGSSVEAPNAYRPGQASVAEASYDYANWIARGKARDDGLLFDNRAAPLLTDAELADDEVVRAALRFAYGDSSDDPRGCVLHDPPCAPPSWGAPIDRILRERLDASTSPEDVHQYYLNQPASPEGAVITAEMLGRLPRPARGWMED